MPCSAGAGPVGRPAVPGRLDRLPGRVCAGAGMVPIEAALSGVLRVPLRQFLGVMLGVHLLVGLCEGAITFASSPICDGPGRNCSTRVVQAECLRCSCGEGGAPPARPGLTARWRLRCW